MGLLEDSAFCFRLSSPLLSRDTTKLYKLSMCMPFTSRKTGKTKPFEILFEKAYQSATEDVHSAYGIARQYGSPFGFLIG